MRQFFLWVLLTALVLFSLNSPMGWVFPIWIVVHLFRDRLKRFLDRRPLGVGFILSGLAFGLLTEGFAILDNWNVPPDRKILLHPDPAVDLLMGFFYYLLFIVTWYLILRQRDFPKSAIFILSGLFGLATEQGGAVLAGLPSNPILGVWMAFLVMSVYGIFPMPAYALTEHRFPVRAKPRPWHYPPALFFLFAFWAVYGNVIHKSLLALFPT
ncbi:MAG: hypothetical protein ACYC26_13715 [Phycisphaerales bacterium]